MKSVNVVVAASCLLALGVAIPGESHASPKSITKVSLVSYGANTLEGQKPSLIQKSSEMKEFAISDKAEIAFIRKTAGSKYADRLLHRHTTPLNVSQAAKEMKYTTSSTSNWGGYIVSPALTPKGVSGDFRVPLDSNGLIAPWTGVGGFTGTQLIQTGVLAGNNPSVISQPMAWTEELPAAPNYWFYINTGDQMYSSVSYDSDTGCWNLLIQDTSTGNYYATEYSYSPDASAEWVIEGHGTDPIGNFTVNFTNASWSDSNNTSRDIDYSTGILYKSTLKSGSGEYSQAPSAISDSSSYSSFSISR